MPTRQMAFPFTVSADGRVLSVTDEIAAAKQRILNCLTTLGGERVMRPSYGSGVHRLLFEPANAVSPALRKNIKDRLVDGCPELSIRNVQVVPVDDAGTGGPVLSVTVAFSLPDVVNSSVLSVSTVVSSDN